MNRQKAFESKKPLLKGGLHCHTTLSDGQLTPAEAEALAKKNGYDFLAITDHRVYNRIDYAPELGLTIIPGMEFDSTPYSEYGHGSITFHSVILGSNDESNPIKNGEKFEKGKTKNQDDFEKYLEKFRAMNNICFYCHPQWSGTPSHSVSRINSFFGVELWNSGSALKHKMDCDNGYFLDEMIAEGHKNLVGLSVDDAHPFFEHGKGWVMVNSENNVNDILSALTDGAFYSSTGAEIYDFYIEDNVAHVKCSPAAEVSFCSARHRNMVSFANEDEYHSSNKNFVKENDLIVEASLDLSTNCGYKDYVRVHIVDKEGHQAWSNPLWIV